MTTPQLRAPHWRLVRGTHPAARFWGGEEGGQKLHPKLINTTKLICLGLARYTYLSQGKESGRTSAFVLRAKNRKSNHKSENIHSTYVGVASWPRRKQHNAKQTQTPPQVVRATMPCEGFG